MKNVSLQILLNTLRQLTSKHGNCLPCCLFRQNDRCTEIVFSRHQNTENQQNETHDKIWRTYDYFLIWNRHICTFASLFLLLLCKWGFADFTHHITIIYFQTPKPFTILFYKGEWSKKKNSFWGKICWKWTQWNTQQISRELTIHFI